MIAQSNYTDRDGQAREMRQRQIRVTEDENKKLNELIDLTGLTLRDLITGLIEEEYKKLTI
jgi:hypothetical protein